MQSVVTRSAARARAQDGIGLAIAARARIDRRMGLRQGPRCLGIVHTSNTSSPPSSPCSTAPVSAALARASEPVTSSVSPSSSAPTTATQPAAASTPPTPLRLRAARRAALARVSKHGQALRWVPRHVQTKRIVLAAVKQDGLALRWAALQDDDIRFAAVRQNGLALKWAKPQDPDLCLAALRNNICATQFVRNEFFDVICVL